MKPNALLPWTAVLGGLLAVALFSLTIPLMRLAVHDLDPTILGVGRILLAAVPAVIVLGFIGVPRLSWVQFGRLCLVTSCLVFGFAWLVATALRTVPSHHAAIVPTSTRRSRRMADHSRSCEDRISLRSSCTSCGSIRISPRRASRGG